MGGMKDFPFLKVCQTHTAMAVREGGPWDFIKTVLWLPISSDVEVSSVKDACPGFWVTFSIQSKLMGTYYCEYFCGVFWLQILYIFLQTRVIDSCEDNELNHNFMEKHMRKTYWKWYPVSPVVDCSHNLDCWRSVWVSPLSLPRSS